jgi:predicted aspartyl protease
VPRVVLTFALGIVIGQWLAGSAGSAADYHARAQRAWQGPESLRALQRALLTRTAPPAGARQTTVPLEHELGVWTAPVVLNGRLRGRFLVDTGSSVTVVSPRVAAEAGITPTAEGTVELHTLGGRTAGPAAVVATLRVGSLELRDAPVVLHEPGPPFDGILGNNVLGRYRITLDADRRQLELRPLGRD